MGGALFMTILQNRKENYIQKEGRNPLGEHCNKWGIY